MVELAIWPSRTFSFSKNCLREILKFLKNFGACAHEKVPNICFFQQLPRWGTFLGYYTWIHICLDYIYFLGVLLFSNCPAGENFLGYYIRIIDRIHIQSSLAFLIVFSRERRGKIPHPHSGKKFGIFLRGDFSQLGKKKKNHCQRLASLDKFFLPKLASLAKSLSPSGSLRSPKTVCKRLAARCLRTHVCAVCRLTPPLVNLPQIVFRICL